MAMDLVTLIFQDLLKISPELLARYPNVQDKLFYLFLLPHIVLFLFLLAFAEMVIRGHSRIRNLVIISAYIYVIYSGFYNTIASIASVWYSILIPITFFLFIFFFFMPWTKFQKTVHFLGRAATEPLAKRHELERLYDELKHINGMLFDELRGLGINVNYPNTYKGRLIQDFRTAADRYKERFGEDALKEWEKDMRKLLMMRDEIIRKIEELERYRF